MNVCVGDQAIFVKFLYDIGDMRNIHSTLQLLNSWKITIYAVYEGKNASSMFQQFSKWDSNESLFQNHYTANWLFLKDLQQSCNKTTIELVGILPKLYSSAGVLKAGGSIYINFF